MTPPPAGEHGQDKLALWVGDFMRKLKELTTSEAAKQSPLEACNRFAVEEIEPILSLWSPHEAFREPAHILRHVRRALEVWAKARQAGHRAHNELRALWVETYRLKRLLAPEEDEQPTEGVRLRDVPWRTVLGNNGEILFDAGAGHLVPLRGNLNQLAWPKVMALVAQGVPPYPTDVRPVDVRGRPGGLIRVHNAARLIVVGDIHGRYENLEHILKDKENLRALSHDNVHLLFLGDAIHPAQASQGKHEVHADSFRVMFLILSLKAAIPDRVHYLLGNHENAHLGGLGASKAEASEHIAFQKYVRRHFSEEVLQAYVKFLEAAPVAAKFSAPNGDLLFVHGGPSRRLRSEQGLIDICAGGRRGKGLTDVLWNRNFEPEVIGQFLRDVHARFIIAGHTRPTLESAEKYGYEVLADLAFGQVAGRLLLLSSQGGTFGYLDIDLTRDLPERVDALHAPDGKPALRLFKPKA